MVSIDCFESWISCAFCQNNRALYWFLRKLENSWDATKLHKWILIYNTRETWRGANSCHPSFLLIPSKFYILYENALIWTSVYKTFFIFCLCWGHLDARSKYCKATCWKSIPYISLVLSPAASTAYCFRESKYIHLMSAVRLEVPFPFFLFRRSSCCLKFAFYTHT